MSKKPYKPRVSEEYGPVWLEDVDTEIDGQKLCGHIVHLGSRVLLVAIRSPFMGFCKYIGFGNIMYSWKVHPYGDVGYESEYGMECGKKALKEIYLENKEIAASRAALSPTP